VIEARKMVIEMLEAFMMRYPWDVRLWIFVSEAMALNGWGLTQHMKVTGSVDLMSERLKRCALSIPFNTSSWVEKKSDDDLAMSILL